MKKLICLVIPMFLIFVSCIFAGIDPDKKVQAAYWLRMNGKADAAKGLLDSILSDDSTLAIAHYEKARLNHYLLLGGGQVSISDILIPAGKAVQHDPSNVTYAYYKALVTFFNAYFAMETGQGDPKSFVDESIREFEKVLAMKPDYHEAMLYLVEFYGLLPADMGGDSAKAAGYAEKLATLDGYYGAKAKAVLATQGTDLVKFWEDLMILGGDKPEYLREAGKACLFAGNPEKAEEYFNKAIQADPSKNILILDLARYHIMQVMQDQGKAGSELPLARTYFERYLNTKPEPVIPLKAYTTGWLGQVEMFLGNQPEAEKKMEEAKAMDPYFSRAAGIPTLLLFDPPDQISHQYFSFFSWF
ncbi:MAG TPA: tetratricopeptide repeat protein [Bacteroidales bacterium]|nr:tetratricopeptide repeat protein [Bacteroidales bacterium]